MRYFRSEGQPDQSLSSLSTILDPAQLTSPLLDLFAECVLNFVPADISIQFREVTYTYILKIQVSV